MALLDYKIPYKNCLISCSGVGEAKVGDVYKFIPDQVKNPDWPDFVKYPIKSIVRDRWNYCCSYEGWVVRTRFKR